MAKSIAEQAKEIHDKIISMAYKQQAAMDIITTDRAIWNSARLAEDLQDELDGRYSITAVNLAVAKLYHCEETTIRRRVHVARRIPQAWCSDNPRLSFGYWKLIADAKHIDDREQARREVIDWIFEHEEQYGELPSISLVKVWMKDKDSAVELWRLWSESIISNMDKIYYDQSTPLKYKVLVAFSRGMLVQFLERGKSALD